MTPSSDPETSAATARVAAGPSLREGRTSGGDGPAGFDPYRAWLNVREVHRPLTAYQLLGLKPLEDDVQAIRAAAGIQRMALQAHRFEAAQEVWEQIQSELEEAIAILLDPDRKTAYDVTLRLQDAPEIAPQGSPIAITGRGTAASVRCNHCGFTSSAMRRFCANCGENLWEPCFKCGTLSMSGEKFCGACGANLSLVIQDELTRIETAIEGARAFREAGRYSEAIDTLSPIIGLNHHRLVEPVQRASELMEAIREERDSRRSAADEALHDAKQHTSECNYQAVIHDLEKVPPSLRTSEMEKLREDAQGRIEEIVRLESEIRTLLAEKQTGDLLPKVGEILALKPNHEVALQLAERFRGRRYQMAVKKLQEHHYEVALRLVEQVPRSAWTTEIEAFHRKLSELVRLFDALRTSPVVDQTLIGVAERLEKLAPKDVRVAKLCEELASRTRRAAESASVRPVPWTKPPPRTHLGLPVEWLTDFRQIAINEASRPNVREHPGQLYAACGLALQGLGLGPVHTNLVLREGQGLVGRMSQLVSGPILWKRPAQSAWGLDLSSSGLKAVKLVAEGADRSVTMVACDAIEHRKLLGQAVNDEERKTLIAETLKTFCSRNEVKAERLCAGLPGRTVLIRELKMPRIDNKKLPRVIEYEARRQLPMSLDDLVWGYELLDDEAENTASSGDIHVAVVAAKRFLLKDHLARFSNAGLNVDMVQSDCLALHNFIRYDRYESGSNGQAAAKSPPVAVVDLGSDVTNFVVSSPQYAWFRGTGFGSQNITKSLLQHFRLTVAQAEEMKRDLTTAESYSECCKVIEPLFEEFVDEIRDAFEVHAQARGHRRIAAVYGVGGGFRMHGLLRYLWLGR